MFTWADGERFNERKLVDEWLVKNRADNPAHIQAGRATQQGQGIPFLYEKLEKKGVQLLVLWGVQVGLALGERFEPAGVCPKSFC